MEDEVHPIPAKSASPLGELSKSVGHGERWKVAVAFALVYTIWGSTYLAIRVSDQTMPPFLMGGIRFLASGAIMLGLATARHDSLKVSKIDAAYAALVGLLLFGGGNGGVIFAELTVASGLTALIVAVVPLWIVGFEAISRSSERLGSKGTLGILLGFVGVAILVFPDIAGRKFAVAFGELVLIMATFAWALGTLISRRRKVQTSLFVSSALQMFAGGLAMTTISIAQNNIRPEIFAAVSTASWWAVGYLIVVGACIGFTAYVYLLRNVPVSRVATYAYVNPIIAVILGRLILGEALSIWILAGMATILFSLTLVRLR